MLIECKIHRPGGSKVDLFGREYHFKPDAFGRHVCDVNDDAAIERLLEITEGYAKATAKAKAAPLAVATAPAKPLLNLAPNVPAGAPSNLDEMSRVELLAYGASLGLKLAPNLSDDKLRVNIALALEERAGLNEAPPPPDAPAGEPAGAEAPPAAPAGESAPPADEGAAEGLV